MRAIIAGSRQIVDFAHVAEAVDKAVASLGCQISEVVSGRAAGVDQLGEQWAHKWNVYCRHFPANWSVHGKAAGPIRNVEMARYAAAKGNGLLIAVWDGKSRGTRHMINTAVEYGLRVYVHLVLPPRTQVATRTVHCKKEPFDIYIGRPSDWGNPFTHLPDSSAPIRVETREEAVASFAAWLPTQPELVLQLARLKGKKLGCWCSPEMCHGDVLAELADRI